MTSILTFFSTFKTIIVTGFLMFCLGVSLGGYAAWDYTSTEKQSEISSILQGISKEREVYTNNLLKKERENASISATLNDRIATLTSEKAKVLASLDRLQHQHVRMLNASCVPTSTDRASSSTSSVVETSSSYCRLNESAESALFGYIKQAEELNEYAKAAKLYVDAIEQQRQRMSKEQE